MEQELQPLLALLDQPPENLDLSSCHNTLKGIINKRVSKECYQNIKELMEAVETALGTITKPELCTISHSTWHCTILCHKNDGLHTDILNEL